MPGAGIVVLEVKGGSVWHNSAGWWTKRFGEDTRIRPVEQALRVKYALRNYVEADARWGSRGRVAWAHGVVTPYSTFAVDFAVPELPRPALHARDDQATLATRVRGNAELMRHDQRPPSYDDVEAIVDILAGRLPTSHDVNADADDRGAVVDRLTQEQATLLRVTRLIHRVEVRGGAGSGKTVLALQQAKELTRGRDGSSQRVALLCYSIGLAEHLKRQVASWPRRHRPAFVGTFHELGMLWGRRPETARTAASGSWSCRD
jgi:hypothetical protein